jgi:hypothetical protein
MESHYTGPDLASLDTADRIARSAYLWLRQRAVSCGLSFALDGQLKDGHRTQLIIAGFIFELCDALQLTSQHCLLAAYAYVLLDGGDADPLVIATILRDAHTVPQTSVVFSEGRSMAGEMLTLLDNSEFQAVPQDGFGRYPARLIC